MSTTAEASRSVPLWEDFVDIFISPAELFRRRADQGWGLPLAIIAAVCLALYYALLPANEIVMRAALQARAATSPGLDPKVIEATAQRMRYIGGIFVPIGLAVVTLVAGVVLWLFGRLADERLTFRNAMVVATYSSAIVAVQQVVVAVLLIVQDNRGLPIDPVRDMSTGLLRFLPAEDLSPLVSALIGRLDVFAIWQMVLWIVGVRAIARFTRAEAMVAGIGAWLVLAAPALLRAFAP
jgi:hypothetical protein